MSSVISQITTLKNALNRANELALQRDLAQIDLEPTVRRLKGLVGSGLRSSESLDRIQDAVETFLDKQHLSELQQARYAAFGVHIETGVDKRSLLSEPEKFDKFLGLPDGIEQWKDRPAWYRRVLQGLVISYFTYDPFLPSERDEKKDGWIKLRDYLYKNIEFAAEKNNPEWLECCVKHKSLFTSQPGDDFAEKVLSGDNEELNSVLELLRAKESWFPRELVLGKIRVVTEKYNSNAFEKMVDPLLDMLEEHKTIVDDGLSLLINRYAKSGDLKAHDRLKDVIVLRWDNPWLQGSIKKWPAQVTKEAKELVSEWLTGEFIEAFFTKLAEDADSDTRRMNFWMTYRKQMKHVRFALGTDFMRSSDPDVIFLKNKMKGLYSKILGRAKSNAFIMFMGDVIAVEFGAANNALYLYSTTTGMPFNLDEDLQETVDGRNSLKSKRLGESYTHQDIQGGYKCWEQRIADELFVNFGVKSDSWQTSKYASAKSSARSSGSYSALHASTGGVSHQSKSSIEGAHIPVFANRNKNVITTDRIQVGKTSWADLFAKPYSIELLIEASNIFGFLVEDNRAVGGAIWVRVDGDNSTRNRVLRNWGFQYKANKGWWK